MQSVKAHNREYILSQLCKQCQDQKSFCDVVLLPKFECSKTRSNVERLWAHSAILVASLGLEFLELIQPAKIIETSAEKSFIVVEPGFEYIYNFTYSGEFFVNTHCDDVSYSLVKSCILKMVKNEIASDKLLSSLMKEYQTKRIETPELTFSQIVIETDSHPEISNEFKMEICNDDDDFDLEEETITQINSIGKDTNQHNITDYSVKKLKNTKSKTKRRKRKAPDKNVIGMCCDMQFTLYFPFSDHIIRKHTIPMATCLTCKELFEFQDLLNHFTDCFIDQNDDLSLESALETAVECPSCKHHMQLKDFPNHIENQVKKVTECKANELHTLKTCLSFKCKICKESGNEDEGDKPSRLSSFMRLHSKRFHAYNAPGNYRELCIQCGLMVFPRNMENHMKRHLVPVDEISKQNEDVSVECDVCNKSVKRRRLSLHKRTHFEKYPCRHCKKIFNRKENRTVHERIHTGHKLFICDECGMSYLQLIQLKRHHKVHQKDKLGDGDMLTLTFAPHQ